MKGSAPGENVDVISIPDTMTIITRSVYIDTLNTSRTYSNLPTIHALGQVDDPVMGGTTAGIYFQVIPTANSFTFSTGNFTIDSAFIIMPYTGFKWGDTLTSDTQAFTAYRVTEALSKDATYYSNETRQTDANPISKPFAIDITKLKLSDSISVTGINRPTHLRIPLTDAFIQEIAQNSGGSNFETKEAFLNWLKGIYIAPTSSTKGVAMPYFYLDGASDYVRSAIAFYYTEATEPGTVKTAFFNFSREDCAHYNYIKRDYSTLAQAIFNRGQQNPNASDTMLLLQNEPGATIDVRIPYIKTLPKGVINKAQFVITKLSLGTNALYTSPIRIDPYRVNADNSISAITDLVDEDYSFVGGTSSSVDLGGGINVTQYTINLPREVQKAIIEQWDELHLRIRGAPLFPAAYSLAAGGRAHDRYSFDFNIIYTTLK